MRAYGSDCNPHDNTDQAENRRSVREDRRIRNVRGYWRWSILRGRLREETLMSDEDDELSEAAPLEEVAASLRAGRQELVATIYALEHGRRTPAQRQQLCDRAQRLLRRSELIRRRISQRRRI